MHNRLMAGTNVSSNNLATGSALMCIAAAFLALGLTSSQWLLLSAAAFAIAAIVCFVTAAAAAKPANNPGHDTGEPENPKGG